MLTVEVADIILQEIAISKTQSINESLLVLWNAPNRIALVLAIDPASATAITLVMNNYHATRPLTHEFTANLVKSSQAVIQGVSLHLQDGDPTIIARVTLEKGEKSVAVRGSIGDVTLLALQLGLTINLDDVLWQTLGIALPAGMYPTYAGLRRLFPQFKRSYEAVKQRWYYYVQNQHRSLRFTHASLKSYIYKTRQSLRKAGRWISPDDDKLSPEMIPVQVLDVTFQPNEPSLNAIVLLWSDSHENAMLIAVGVTEGMAIVDGMVADEQAEPSPHQFCANLLHGSSANIQAVVVSDLKQEIYYATVYVETDNGVQTLDARSSDAIALAVQMHIPIYVAAKVMEQAKIDIKAPDSKNDSRFQHHLTAFNRYRQQEQARREQVRPLTKVRAQQILDLTFELRE